MNSLPVIARELLVGGRRPTTYRHRVLAATSACSAAALIFTLYRPFTPVSDLSLWLFVSVSILGFGYALLAGAFLTCDSICSERRDGTLPLLLLTRLSGFDIVLCKLVAALLITGGALLAILPVLGLPLQLGGVTGGEFARVGIAILFALLFSLAAGLLCSTVCRDTLSAMISTFGILLVLTGAFWLFANLTGGAWVSDLVLLNPMSAFVNAFDQFYCRPAGPERYWASLAGTASLTLAQFVMASRLVRRFQFPPEARRVALPPCAANRRRVEGNPYEWLLLLDRFPSVGVWGVGSLMTAAWAGFLLASFTTSNQRLILPLYLMAVVVAVALHLAFKGLVIFRASSRLAEDRQNGALELLLTTPLTPREIVTAHRRALRLQMRPMIGLLISVNLAIPTSATGAKVGIGTGDIARALMARG